MKPIRLAFSGSGYLAGIHAGAACAVLDYGYDIVEVAGTSGGSICAAAVAVGMKQDGLKALAIQEDFGPLLDGGPITYLRSGGWDSGENLYLWLDKQFGGRTMVQTAIPLQIIATDVVSKSAYTFSSIGTPGTPIALACRASSAVPFVYAPVKYDGKVLADGGMVANIPVDRLTVDDAPRIGIDVDDNSPGQTSPSLAYAGTLIHLLLASNENTEIHLGESTGAKVVRVPTSEDPLNVHMTVQAKQALFDAGYAAVQNMLKPRVYGIGGTG